MRISIGPFFSQEQAVSTLPDRAIIPLNISFEWSTPDNGFHIPLYKALSSSKTRPRHIVIRAKNLPCDVDCAEAHIIESNGETFLPLDFLITTLYRNREVSRPIRALLQEMSSLVSIESAVTRPAPAGSLVKAAEQAGFRLIKGFREGQTVLASIGWQAPETSQLWHVANFRCRAFGEELVSGQWITPQGEIGVSSILASEFTSLFPRPPHELISPTGRGYLTALAPQV